MIDRDLFHRDIYLLDDPLSAVDPQVGQHIFERCIRNELRGKTVLFVTHQLQFLSRCDQVIFMERGRVLDQGDHKALMKRNPQYSSLIQTFNRDASVDATGDASADASPDASPDAIGDATGDATGDTDQFSAGADDTISSEDEMFSVASVTVFSLPRAQNILNDPWKIPDNIQKNDKFPSDPGQPQMILKNLKWYWQIPIDPHES